MTKRGAVVPMRTRATARGDAEARAVQPAPDLVHLRITGRHGVFLLEQGATTEQTAVVDTRPESGAVCSCWENAARAATCQHINLLRACGFLAAA